MKRSLTMVSACALAIAGLAAGIAVTGLSANTGPPNQGDPDKILTVVSGYQCSGDLGFLPKVEGGLGQTITVTATSPIVKVTIKSGEKATLVSASWAADFLSGTITISQDVSNYVVWTCAGGGTTTGTTETTQTTTETTPTTTETTSTTTETTPTTTETTPTTTETTPSTTETTPSTTETTPTTTETTPTTTETTATTTETTPTTTPEQPGGVAGVATPAQPTTGVAGVATPERPGRMPTPPTTTGTAGVAGVATPELAYTP
jgi:hypothetical protein